MMAAHARDLHREIEVLREKLAEKDKDFELFRDSVVKPVLKHVYSKTMTACKKSQVVTVLIDSDDGHYSTTFIFNDLKIANDFRERVIPIMKKRGYGVYHAVLRGIDGSVESAIENSIIKEYLEEE